MRELKEVYIDSDLSVYRVVLPPIGVNTYLLYSRETLLVIDPGFEIKSLIESFPKRKRRYEYVLLTHSHFDHIAGTKELNFEIAVSTQAKEGLTSPIFNLSKSLFSEEFSLENPLTLNIREGENTLGDLNFNAYVLPGHTPGDTVYDFGNFIFTGDLVFRDSIGRTDFPFSNSNKMLESLKKFKNIIKNREDVIIFPGHMGYTTVKDILYENYYLRDL